MSRPLPRPLKVELDFTDARLTSFGGWSPQRPGSAKTQSPSRAKPLQQLKPPQKGAKQQPLNRE